MSLRLAVVVLVALGALWACGNQPSDDIAVPANVPPGTDPTIVGFITDVMPFEPVTEDCVDPDPNAEPDSPVSSDETPVCSDPEIAPLGTVLVEEDPSAVSGDNKISFTVGRDTALLTENSGSYGPLRFDDLVDGMAVSAWADGAIAESYPAQATAAAMVVRPG
jgi:hypothetical protein